MFRGNITQVQVPRKKTTITICSVVISRKYRYIDVLRFFQGYSVILPTSTASNICSVKWSKRWLPALLILLDFILPSLLGRFQQYFSYILPVSYIGGGNHWPSPSHWYTLFHYVVSNTLRHERGSNSQL